MLNKFVLGVIHFILFLKTLGIRIPIEITQLFEQYPLFLFLLSYVYLDSLIEKPFVSITITAIFCIIIYRKDIWDEIVGNIKLL